jgi:hypothetical protein
MRSPGPTCCTNPALARQVMPGTEVLLWAHGSPPRALVAPARELVREVPGR